MGLALWVPGFLQPRCWQDGEVRTSNPELLKRHMCLRDQGSSAYSEGALHYDRGRQGRSGGTGKTYLWVGLRAEEN